MPSGSRPLAGSSSTSTGGSPSSAAASAEPLPHAERVAADPPVRRRRRGRPGRAPRRHRSASMPAATAITRRWSRAVRPGWKPVASSDGADRARRVVEVGVGPAADQWRCPRSGATRPSSIRSVVVLPAPLGPRKPVTGPGVRPRRSRSSTATTVPEPLGQPLEDDLRGVHAKFPSPSGRTQKCEGRDGTGQGSVRRRVRPYPSAA